MSERSRLGARHEPVNGPHVWVQKSAAFGAVVTHKCSAPISETRSVNPTSHGVALKALRSQYEESVQTGRIAVQASRRASDGLIRSARFAGPMQANRHAPSITADVTPRYPA